jgi:hypothetical protein
MKNEIKQTLWATAIAVGIIGLVIGSLVVLAPKKTISTPEIDYVVNQHGLIDDVRANTHAIATNISNIQTQVSSINNNLTPTDVKTPEDKMAAGCVKLIILLIGYFLPSLVAASFNHKNGAAILVLNLLLGWTLLGWIIALIWSFTSGK